MMAPQLLTYSALDFSCYALSLVDDRIESYPRRM